MRRARARPRRRSLAVGCVVEGAGAEGRVGADRLDLHRVQGDLVGCRRGRRGEHCDPFDRVGRLDRPLEHVHGAHRPADDRCEPLDAETAREGELRTHLVADREEWEARTPFRAVGCERCRPCRALAAADDVRGEHEPAVGVDRQAGTDDTRPPARAGVRRTGRADEMAVARQRVQDEDRVVARRGERAPLLVGDPDGGQHPARLERQVADADESAVADRVALAPGAGRGCAAEHRECARLGHDARGHRVRLRLPVHDSILPNPTMSRGFVTPRWCSGTPERGGVRPRSGGAVCSTGDTDAASPCGPRHPCREAIGQTRAASVAARAAASA